MEFSLIAIAYFSNIKCLDVLTEVFEYLDLNEAELAARLCNKTDIERAIKSENQLSGIEIEGGDEVFSGIHLFTWFIHSYDDSIDELIIIPDKNNSSVRIEAEGWDHEANEFVVALAQILISVGATKLTIEANSEAWSGNWCVDGKEISVNLHPIA